MSVSRVSLTPLSPERHATLRVRADAVEAFAQTQHVMQVRAAEVVQAVCCYPVFFTRSAQSGQWLMSAMAGFEPGESLVVQDGRWVGSFQPSSIMTYPLFLMQGPDEKTPFVVGIDERNPVFSEDDGEPFFDADGRPSAWVTERSRLLEASVQSDIQTEAFITRMRDLKLTRAINVNVHHADGQMQTITGLHTIDEDRLAKLDDGEVVALQNSGYLAIIHGMLMSIFQLNALLRLRNQREGAVQLSHVRLEVARDAGAQEL